MFNVVYNAGNGANAMNANAGAVIVAMVSPTGESSDLESAS